MKEALKQAYKAFKIDEVPVGCVIVFKDKIIARGYNNREKNNMSIGHAEVNAIQKACKKIGNWRLDECDMYITLQPCMMCSGAICLARIKNVYYGTTNLNGEDYFSQTGLNHYPNVEGGILRDECAEILQKFFKQKREVKIR